MLGELNPCKCERRCQMLSVKYASATSAGVLAPWIGWIDFGNNLSLSNANPNATISNSIPGGYTFSCDLSIQVTGNPQITPIVTYQGFPVPTYSAAPFGTTAYTGIGGNVALYSGANPTIGNVLQITILLSNITITDYCGNGVRNFYFFAADAESTNKGKDSVEEIWTVTNESAPWQLVQLIPSISGVTDAGPVVTGVNTNTVVETGQRSDASTTSSNIFVTHNPTSIVATAQVDGGREGFAFGIMLNPYDCDISRYLACREIGWVYPNNPNCYYQPFRGV